jgi:TP901 family phage tail tape measure protein
MTVASLFAELGVDTSPMSGVARDVENKMAPVRKTFREVGTSLTKYVTVPLTGVAAAATKTGTAIDDQFAKIEGLVGESRKRLQGMRSDVLDISAATGKGPEELAEALFFVESAGYRGEEALSVLEASSKAAAAGLGQTKDVADAVTSAVNAYGKENLSASRAVDVLTATVREGKVAADEISSTLGDVIPVASQMGVEFNEVGATLSALTRIGASSSKATTALSATLRTLLKGTDKTKQGLNDLSLSLEGVQKRIRQDGLLPTLQLLKERFDATGVAITDVFPNARALRGVLGLVGQNAEQAEQIFESLNDEVAGAGQEAFDAASQTISTKFNQALRTAQATLDSVYRTFKDEIKVVLDTVIAALERMQGAWDNLSPMMQGVVVAAGAVAASLGPILVGLSGILAILPSVISALGLLGSAAPYVAAVAAAGATLYAKWDEVSRFFTSGGGQEIWQALKTGAQVAWEAIREMTAGVMDAVWTMTDAVAQAFKGTGGLISLIADRVVTAFELLGQVVTPVMDQVTNVVTFAANQLARAVEFIVDILRGDFVAAWEVVKESVTAFGRFFARSLANIADVFLSWVEQIINTIPAVDVDFSGARESLRDFTASVQDNMQQARDSTEGANETFQATMKTMEGVEVQAGKTGAAAKAAGDKAAAGANKAADAADGAAASAQRAKEAFEELGVVDLPSAEDVPIGDAAGAQGADSQDDEGQQSGSFAGVNLGLPENLPQRITDMQALMQGAIQKTKFSADKMIDKVGQGLTTLITKGELFGKEVNSVGDAFKALGNTVTQIIQKMIAQLIAAIAKALLFKALTGGGGSVLSLAGSFLGGGGPSIAGSRAEGGTVDSGKSYVVGEQGPELFTPSRSGQVTPNSQMQGVRKSNAAVVKLDKPKVLPNGDLQYSLEEGGRQQSRRGFPED